MTSELHICATVPGSLHGGDLDAAGRLQSDAALRDRLSPAWSSADRLVLDIVQWLREHRILVRGPR